MPMPLRSNLVIVSTLLAILLFSATNGKAQSPLAPSAPDTTAQADAPERPTDDRSLASASTVISSGLSSDQIIEILQQSPDLVLELKSQVADRLQEQGRQIDANEISDEMLYQQIATSAALRANITTFLRARGYVSDEDLQARPSSLSASESGNVAGPQRSLSRVEGADALGYPTTTPRPDTQSLLDEYGLPEPALHPNAPVRERGREEVNASTDQPKVLRLPAPYNLRSMRDLYTQIPDQAVQLKRFGSEVFLNRNLSTGRGVSARDTPLDIPLGPDYVIGPGDTLTIDMWGGVTVGIIRLVGRDGRILLPEAGSVQLAGLTLDGAQKVIANALKEQYRGAQVVVTVSRLRSVRVYVTGDVQRPGGYDISSLATPLSALYAAGGPTASGSLRVVRHLRGEKLIEEVDLYDFLLHGVRNGSGRFESGDTLLVPPAGPQVALYGAVKRPAIYEGKPGGTSLSMLLDDAGGLTAGASLSHITVERIDAKGMRETVTADAGGGFQVQDGDRVRVQSILPYSERVVYLEGHVTRPGRMPYKDGMLLSDVLHSYRDTLPEPAAHGEIVRLVAPDLHAETIDFDLPDVLIGNGNLTLQPFDTIRVYGRYEADAPKTSILGEVLHPGTYPLSNGMTAAQLVRMAGGFKRDALRERADLTSYNIANGNRVVESLTVVPIGEVVDGTNPSADYLLKPGDVLTIHQITGWDDIGESITIEGQVRFPGSYGFHDGERLSSVLQRAGGLLAAAYPMGAVLVRQQVRELEQKSREELIRQIEANSAAARLSPNLAGGGDGGTLQLIKSQQDQVLQDLKNHPPSGRMVIHISADTASWANTPADIELRRGDVLTIPKQPGFILVTGQVYNATALTYAPGQSAGWYLNHAGGTNSTANRKNIFIIRANGSVIGRRSGDWLDGNVLSTKLNPGDVVVVPQKIIGASLFWRNLLTTAQLASSIAITASVAAL